MLSATITLRMMAESDIPLLYALSRSGNHNTEPDYFETSLQEQNDKKRVVFLALSDDILLGYTHLNFYPAYTPFLRMGIPEIQDLFVHPKARRQGVAKALITACEEHVRKLGGDTIGLGVGVSHVFGAAQQLYARMGYIPDGAGVVFDRIPAQSGDLRPIDNRLCIMMVKNIVDIRACRLHSA